MKSKKERKILVEELREILNSGSGNTLMYFQKRPYTAVRIREFFRGKIYTGLGFAKVNYPDTWSAEQGLTLATEKALHHIARQVLSE